MYLHYSNFNQSTNTGNLQCDFAIFIRHFCIITTSSYLIYLKTILKNRLWTPLYSKNLNKINHYLLR